MYPKPTKQAPILQWMFDYILDLLCYIFQTLYDIICQPNTHPHLLRPYCIINHNLIFLLHRLNLYYFTYVGIVTYHIFLHMIYFMLSYWMAIILQMAKFQIVNNQWNLQLTYLLFNSQNAQSTMQYFCHLWSLCLNLFVWTMLV